MVHWDIINIYIVLFPEPTDCIGKGHMLMIHQELNRPTFCITNKASICAASRLDTFWSNYKVSIMVIIMERTTASVIHTGLPKLHKIAYHLNDVRGIKNFINNPMLYLRHKLNFLFLNAHIETPGDIKIYLFNITINIFKM